MRIARHVNNSLTSNTYILHADYNDRAWIIDPGDGLPILDWLKFNKKKPSGILITHSHFDHIYGTNDILSQFPDVKIYCSQHAISGLLSSKCNHSIYTENPIEISSQSSILTINNYDKIPLWNDKSAFVIYTPGHSRDSVSFLIENNIFSGDSLIPGVRAFSRKFKGGNESESINSQQTLYNISNSETMLYPGHGEKWKSLEVKNNDSCFISLVNENGFIHLN